MDINSLIAQNLTRIRNSKNMSLGQLSEKTGLSKAVLSQIEKGSSNPTINTIWKIAEGLEVSYSALLEPKRRLIEKVRYKELDFQSDDDGHYRLACYFPSNTRRNFEQFILEIDPYSEHKTDAHTRISDEQLLVKKGTLKMQIGEEIFVLNEGDALYFDATVPHIYKNDSDTKVEVFCINYYPND